MFFKSKPLIYLQLLDRSLRYLSISPNDHSILDVGEVVFEENILEDKRIINFALLEARLDALVKEKDWKNAKTHILVMDRLVTVREEGVPALLDESEVEDYLELHMNGTIRMPFENPVFEFKIFEKNDDQQKLMLIAYPNEAIDKYKAVLEKVNLVPEIADLSSLSLYRLAEEQGIIHIDENIHTLILQWNAYSLNMATFNNDRPQFNRDSFSEHLIDSWTINQEGVWVWTRSDIEREAMLEEQLNGIERFLEFYQYSVSNDGTPISEIILAGSYPNLSEVKEKLNERFFMDINIIDVPHQIEQRFASLYGLSLNEKNRKLKKTKKHQKIKAQQQEAASHD